MLLPVSPSASLAPSFPGLEDDFVGATPSLAIPQLID